VTAPPLVRELKGLLPAPLVAEALETFMDMLAAAGADAGSDADVDALVDDLRATDRAALGQVYDAMRETDVFRRIVTAEPLRQAAQAMTGAKRLHSPFQHAVFRMDLAGEPWRGFDWHQDYPYNMLCRRSVTAWTPLTPSGAVNGGVDVIETDEARLYPVDVRLKRDAQGRPLGGRDAFIAAGFHAAFEARSRKPELQPGDVLMFHNTVPHRSGRNPGPRHRYSIQVRFGDLLAPEVIARGWRNRRADGFEAFAALHPDLIASEERP
jgi:hypothetical protein